jgi:hypothetical protein
MSANTTIERFWKYVDVGSASECWQWVGHRNGQGYGKLTVRTEGSSRSMLATRLSALIHFGMFDRRLLVCHHCDNPSCVNPAHLYLGTPHDNMRDKSQRGRNTFANRTHCPSGHEYDELNTYRTKEGKRMCRACALSRFHLRQSVPELRARHAESQRRYLARKRGVSC